MNKVATVVSGLELTPAQAEKRRDDLAKIVKWGSVGAVALFIVAIAPLLFKLMAALAAMAVTGTIAGITIAAAPVWSMKFANWKLQKILEEASRNPIPTLENELLARKTALGQGAKRLGEALGHVESFVTQAEDAGRKHPDLAARWQARAERARGLGESKKKAFARAEQSVLLFEQEVEQARVEWGLILSEAAMNKSLNVIAGDPLSHLKARTALESVTNQMNQAFANMEVELLRQTTQDDFNTGGTKAIEHSPAYTSSVDLLQPQPVKVQR